MGKFKSEINYWIKSEEESDFDINVMSTECTKVPEVGEVIHISNEFDKDWAERVFSDEKWFNNYKEMGFKRPPHMPDPETCVKGYFKVISVRRYITMRYHSGLLSDIFKEINSKSSIPISTTLENFEVFIEPISKEG
jgi:hypothetical protein